MENFFLTCMKIYVHIQIINSDILDKNRLIFLDNFFLLNVIVDFIFVVQIFFAAMFYSAHSDWPFLFINFPSGST